MNGLCSLHFVSLTTFYQFCQQFLCGTVSFNMVFCLKQIPMGVQYANTKGFSFESQKKYFQLWSALQVCGTKGPVIMPGLDNIMAIPNCIITVYSCHCLTQLWVRAITKNTCHSWINFGNPCVKLSVMELNIIVMSLKLYFHSSSCIFLLFQMSGLLVAYWQSSSLVSPSSLGPVV